MKEEEMMLNNKTYDVLKHVVSVVLPASIALIGVVGASFNWPHTEVTMTIVGAVTTFLGTTLGVSNANYKKEETK